MIAGNKSDKEKDREISKEEVMAYCKHVGIEHVDTSAKTGMGVRELYEGITHSIFVNLNSLSPLLEIYRKIEKSPKKRKRKRKGILIDRESHSVAREKTKKRKKEKGGCC